MKQRVEVKQTKILCGQHNCLVKLTDVSTRCSSHPQGKSEVRYEKLVLLHCIGVATALAHPCSSVRRLKRRRD